MINVGIVGGSGYTGGELLRLLYFHPQANIAQITSRQHAGRYIHTVHPNLRDVCRLQFIHPDALTACDVLFLCLPHGRSAQTLDHYRTLAPHVIDLSADFRLNDATSYAHWYGNEHPTPDMLSQFVYGLPEVNRETLRNARYVSGVGCNATVTNLALRPLIQAGIVEHVYAEIKVGSSEAGNTHTAGSHHPVRSGAVRTYSATQHRHQAEIEMILGDTIPIRFSVTAIEMVRGAHLLAHVNLRTPQTQKDIWRLYRAAYNDEPFIRLVNARTGYHRLPEPRIVAGTNYCDIGFERDDDGQHLVVVAAIDNLGKGAAGSAVQSMNLMFGFDECAGLQFPGIYP